MIAPIWTLADRWNTLCPTLPSVREIGKSRHGKIRLRIRERSRDQWDEVLRRLEASPFCHGANERGWVATFDWLIANDENGTKVLEGKYDPRPGPTDGPVDMSKLRGMALIEARERERQARGE